MTAQKIMMKNKQFGAKNTSKQLSGHVTGKAQTLIGLIPLEKQAFTMIALCPSHPAREKLFANVCT